MMIVLPRNLLSFVNSIRIRWEVNADTNYFRIKCPDKDYVDIYKTSKYSECSIPILNLKDKKE